ncbi:alginate O-acetyltransferase complex protein AlgI [Sporomusaceae bacterium BoRhaA]|uniref:MBOAT family O-acyltransferase n=1 Tax=Pelorhabdus rhamnosifermentans TaxID=2772457 RepID=UPI001C064720|nr:MBOAT family O-acyltransferase [Pelorhabdus rhamnosifermentans]MBU2701197.1 alginate O-acetyltransferase complex protein AlgI [Pelorhabdus rhamnosifermentans]
MLFNSYEFIFVFLPIALLVYFMLAKFKLTKLATVSLVIASLVFYSYWDIRYLPLILGSIAFNYTIGSFIEKTRNKHLLAFAILANLFLLGYFKYAAFFMQSFNDILGTSLFIPKITLPLGISFFTFTQIAYLVDAYRGETQKYSLLTYSLFVTVFPHLIAGPILYHKDMIPQFSKLKNFVFSQKNMALGISMFSMGLFKKVIIADQLAPWVNVVFNNADKVSFIEAWTGAIGYTLQLYFDFSGYSEMAIGLGLMFNLSLPINFNSPYKATSIIDFWRRWHITLSAFLKNYLYIPLGGNRNGEINRIRNLLLTMLLGGLWHGAGWTFVIWGGLHGCYLVINHLWIRAGYSLPKLLAWLFTFISVVIAWVFFRSSTVSNALQITATMLGAQGVTFPFKYEIKLTILKNFGVHFANLPYLVSGSMEIVIIAVILIFAITIEDSQRVLRNFKPSIAWLILISTFCLAALTKLNNVSEFLYFQF